MNTRRFRQSMIMLLAVFLTLFGLMIRSEEVYAAQETELSAINVWTSENMQIYYNATTFCEAPQILYLIEKNGELRPLFCVEYGKAAHTGDVLSWVSEENYTNLNADQKLAISHVLGCGVQMNPPSEDGLGYAVDYTNTAYQAQIKNYWSTQLMIWYYIDKYSSNPGGGNTGGITWAGVEATCNAGWGSLDECNRIWNAVEKINQIPSFGVAPDAGVEIPAYELKYNSTSGKYEILLENTNANCSLKNFAFPEGTGLEYQFSNADGTANDNGNYLKVTSDTVITPDAAITVPAAYEPSVGDLWYLTNITSVQPVLACYGTKKESSVEYAFKVYTQNVEDLSISKKDITTQAELPGCTLTITSEDGTITYDTWVSGTTPHIITGLESGNYVLTEINPADGYTTASSITFAYDKTSNQAQSITMYNSKTRVELLKTDEDGNPLSGAKLEVRRADGSLVESWTSGSTAHVIEGLPSGNYVLKEVEAPSGYKLADDVSFTVTNQHGIVAVRMSDKKTKVELLKTDESGKPLAGAKLELRRADGTLVESWASGNTAHVVEGLAVGRYELREIDPPNGYTIAKSITFTVKDTKETQRIVMKDEAVRGVIRIYKTGDQAVSATVYDSVYGSFKRLEFAQKPLEGTVFEIYRTADDVLVDTVTTGKDGYAVSKELPWGDYYLVEIRTKNGLVLDAEPVPVKLVLPDDFHDEVYYADVSVENQVGNTEINVYKKGEILNVADGTYSFGTKPLPGVIFGVYADADILDPEGNILIGKDECIGFIKTGEDGKASLKDALVEGAYYYREVQTLDGYILDESKHEFTLTLGNTELNTMDVNKENPDINRLYKTRLQLIKSDSADRDIVLSGVVFELYNDKDELMGIYTTDENGRIIVEDLPYGSYYFKETRAADGYQIDTSMQSFLADSEGMQMEVTNERIPETPQTGDPVPVGLLTGIVFLFGILFLITRGRRRQY